MKLRLQLPEILQLLKYIYIYIYIYTAFPKTALPPSLTLVLNHPPPPPVSISLSSPPPTVEVHARPDFHTGVHHASSLLYNSNRILPIFNAPPLLRRERRGRGEEKRSGPTNGVERWLRVGATRDKYVPPRLRFHEGRPRSWKVSFIRYAQTTV